MDFAARTQHEQDLEDAVAAVLAAYRAQLADGREISVDELERELLFVLRLRLAGTFLAAARQMAEASGAAGFDDLENHAEQYAAERAAELARDFADRVREELYQEHVRGVAARRGVIQLADALLPSWRAEAIAITETTRAASHGMNLAAAALVTGSLIVAAAVGVGILTNRFWRTASDDRVCAICSPLDGQEARVWAGRFPAGPPAHPNCRCYVTYGGLL